MNDVKQALKLYYEEGVSITFQGIKFLSPYKIGYIIYSAVFHYLVNKSCGVRPVNHFCRFRITSYVCI